jgi:hypothetical protein
MNKMNSGFWKYSLALIVVAVIFIAIGALSLSRTSGLADNRIFQSINIKEKIALLSDENLALDTKIKELENKYAELEKNEDTLSDRLFSVESLLSAYKWAFEAEDAQEASKNLGMVDKMYLTEDGMELYNNVEEKIKEINEEKEEENND